MLVCSALHVLKSLRLFRECNFLMLERTLSLHPVCELRRIVAVHLFIATSTKCIFRWVFSARFLKVLCGQLEGQRRLSFSECHLHPFPIYNMSKFLSLYLTELNNVAFCCRILVKWTSFLGVRVGLQKGGGLNGGDISSYELGFWVLAASHFLRRNCIRFDQILTAWAFPLQLFYNAGIFVVLRLLDLWRWSQGFVLVRQ